MASKNLNVTAEQIDEAVKWIIENKEKLEQDSLVLESCFNRMASAEVRLDKQESAVTALTSRVEALES